MLKLTPMSLAALALASCNAPAPPRYLTAPADSAQPVPPVRYVSVTAGTRTFRPVDPKGWEEQNKEVAPKPGEEGMHGMHDMGGMKGMDGMKDMDGMKGMDGKKGMDGMKGMGGK